jgi:hypothetical protein
MLSWQILTLCWDKTDLNSSRSLGGVPLSNSAANIAIGTLTAEEERNHKHLKVL